MSDEITNEVSRINYDSMLREAEALQSCSYGTSYLDDALLGIFPREVTLVGARTGSGKTEFATQVVIANSKKHKTVLYYALDHENKEIETRILWKSLVAKAKADGLTKKLRFAEWRAGRYTELLCKYENSDGLRFAQLESIGDTKFIYQKGKVTAQGIKQMLIECTSHQFSLCIVDHFHALKLDGNRFDGQRDAMQTLVEAAQESKIPILIMGQFRKRTGGNKSVIPDMEEFSGPADIIYLPSNIIVFGPNNIKGASTNETLFHIEKSRIASDAKGFVGVHAFDLERKTYSKKYRVAKFSQYGDPTSIDRPLDIPEWAINADRPKFYEELNK